MVRNRLEIVVSNLEDREPKPMDDRELAEAAKNGDEGAFGALVERYAGGVHRVVSRMLGDEEEAWDVVQMAWLRAWQRLGKYNRRWSFSTWIYRIATNLAIDVIRARSSRERAHREGGSVWLRPAPAPDGSAVLANEREIEQVLSRLVVCLSPQQRAAFILREVEGLDTSAVARVLGCSAATVRNHIFHARRALKKELARRFPEYVPGHGGS